MELQEEPLRNPAGLDLPAVRAGFGFPAKLNCLPFFSSFRCISAAVKRLIVTNRILHPPLPQSLVECIYEHQKTAIASVQFLLCHFEDRLLNVNCHDKYCVNCKS